jgi:hypothetical protein
MSPYMCFLKEQKSLICQQHNDIVMKEFVRYGARRWLELQDEYKSPYIMMAEVDKVRYERDK